MAFDVKMPKIPSLVKVIGGKSILDEEEKRLRIPNPTKNAVYKRAKGRCERCSRPLKMVDGEFHHHRDPKIKPTAKTVQFLCAHDHKKYGHKWESKVIVAGLEQKKVPKLRRLKVKRDYRSPYWKQLKQKSPSKSRTKTKNKTLSSSKRRSKSQKTARNSKRKA